MDIVIVEQYHVSPGSVSQYSGKRALEAPSERVGDLLSFIGPILRHHASSGWCRMGDAAENLSRKWRDR